MNNTDRIGYLMRIRKKFYQEMETNEKVEIPQPEPSAAREFWESIWGKTFEHRKGAEWVQTVKDELRHVPQQEDMEITEEVFKKVIGRLRPWKAPGPDDVQAFWIKRFTSLHVRICHQLNTILNTGTPPDWLTSGRTVLIPKDPSKGNIPSNYRPITCLPIMCKLLTGMITEHIFTFLAGQNIDHTLGAERMWQRITGSKTLSID